MVAVPADTPVTIPLIVLTAATDVSLLLHVPPETGLESVLELPAQSVAEPAIGGSAELTVIVFVVLPHGVA